MQLPIRVNGISVTGHELVEAKGPRMDRERSFLTGERRLPRHSQQRLQVKRWSGSYRTGSSRRTSQTMSRFVEDSW